MMMVYEQWCVIMSLVKLGLIGVWFHGDDSDAQQMSLIHEAVWCCIG